MNLFKPKDTLTCIAIQEKGDWFRIYERVCNEDFPPDQVISEELGKLKCQYLTILDPEYPEWLKWMNRPPFVIFYYGDISLVTQNHEKCLAVIGSRECTDYGMASTQKIVKDIAKDLIIVSGLAKGIDAIAAETAIQAGGKTVAILGCGIDVCYPTENLSLYNKIKSQHLLLSEYPGRTTPSINQFPFRNRLIAYFSKKILVTEAGERSGTSITVSWGLCAGRDIMCIPHPIGTHSACNRLLKEGAILVENGEDVLDFMK